MSGKGSLMYLAPEVLYNGRYNRKADCYSFAMVFYELLTLNKPFTSVTNQQIFRELIVRHKARPSLELAEIPASVQDLLRNAWNNTVSQRWTMKQICERLEDIIIEETQQLDRHGMEVSEEELEEHIITPATSPLCGGEMVDLVLDFARDVRLGFQILTGQDKTLSLRSGPMEASSRRRRRGFLGGLLMTCGCSQEEDNVVPTIERQGTDLSNATMATEEPLK
ncbi:activated protein kinase kinase kinase 7 [Seminavis robusta]|uniref:Activated protein kinase kinase kinase 7 n=1 Tax=Seminavis robusta TaxID=568900 RepID=A0A9N8EPT8_9STRA|nr:activated protein kinase kinase kinase 7 [Seminavis robusta]|eukprot:Sro1358_g265830.1 activated protein kinase kinase kinase 7 (223) ;mRNA; r:2308-2976